MILRAIAIALVTMLDATIRMDMKVKQIRMNCGDTVWNKGDEELRVYEVSVHSFCK